MKKNMAAYGQKRIPEPKTRRRETSTGILSSASRSTAGSPTSSGRSRTRSHISQVSTAVSTPRARNTLCHPA
ncbi:MAG: hypothetical protein A4E29_01247 [Methanomassiliicoccales archaeon PtaB.Bin134]|nr:MAG: hypothetical protein A4E29_01247 [Methanomassiliicoccales archaeon PtaB.Bin134]